MKHLFLLLTVWLLFFSCANVGNPTGGPRDETPPRLIRSIPENGTVNFTVPYITLIFDEFIELKSPQQNIIVSPQLSTPIEYQVKRKTINVALPDTLASNTTYTINFGEAVVDLNEGNPIPNLVFVFSTGSKLDSLTLSGSVRDYRSGKPLSSMTVALYDKLSDTMVTKGRPFYMRKTNDQGTFSFEYLKPDTFQLVAFSDANSNLVYDEGTESIGFIHDFIALPSDSTYDLLVTTPFPSEQRITSLKRVNQSQITGSLAKPLEQSDTLVFTQSINNLYFNTSRDSFSCWLDSVNSQNIDAIILRGTDTLSNRTVYGTTSQTVESFYKRNPVLRNASNSLPRPGSIELKSDAPIQIIHEPYLQIIKDSTILGDSTYTISYDSLSTSIQMDGLESGSYELLVLPRFITDIYGRKTDSLTIATEVLGPQDFGSIIIHCHTEKANPYRLFLIDTKKAKPLHTLNFQSDTIVLIPNILPGTYYIEAYIDSDLNGYWSPGKFPGQFPEVFYHHPEVLTVRPNWELEVDVTLPIQSTDH